MAQQKISTPSVVEVLDTVIRASSAYAYPEVGGIGFKDPWDNVLRKLEPYALDPATVIEGLRSAISEPNSSNPFVTTSLYEKRFGTRSFLLVGPTGSGADFEGNDGETIAQAIDALGSEGGWVVLEPATYLLSSTLVLPPKVRLMGIHPETTVLETSSDIVGVQLEQASLLCRVTIQGSNTTTQALVVVGEDATVERCKVLDFSCLGIQLSGKRATVIFTKFESASALNYTTGVALQEVQQVIDRCAFYGQLHGGTVQFESHEGSVLRSLFAEENVGPAFSIPSPILNDNKIVGCHFASLSSLALSIDSGTSTVRYGNTPGSLVANTNNFLDQIKRHTGQPEITSNEMVVVNSFTHDPATDKNATSIFGKIDEAIEQLFDERNVFIDLPDQQFDEFGNAINNFFIWDGFSNTFSWPDFFLRSAHGVDSVATVLAGSISVPPGSKCVIDFTTNTSPSFGSMVLVPLDKPEDKKLLTLITARQIPAGLAIWRDSIKLEAGVSHFDADGHLLAPTRYLGVSETRNPTRQTNFFASPNYVDMTTQLGDQSGALRSLFERSNIQYNRETADARVSTEPRVGSWYSPSEWSLGIPSAPTHLLNIQGTLYGLVPTVGVYYFDRSADGWRELTGCPSSAPFFSMSRWATGLCLLSKSSTTIDSPAAAGFTVPYPQNGVIGYGSLFTGGGGALKSVRIKIRNVNATQGTVTAYLYTVSNGLPQNLLATSASKQATSLPADFNSWVDLSFSSSSYYLEAGVQYAIVVKGENLQQGLLSYQTSQTPWGSNYYLVLSSDSWQAYSQFTAVLSVSLEKLEITTYAPELGWGATLRPNISAPTSALSLTTSGPSAPWYDAGQADFALQTENYSLFTTVDGYSLRWYQDQNFLELLPRVYTETAGTDLGLLSYHPKDTGYNMVLSKEDLCMSGDNGGFSRMSGLPLSRFFNSEILVDTNMVGRESLLRLDWSALVLENYAITQPNGDFILVACNLARSIFYVIAGGRGTARLVAVMDSSTMPNFTPSAWVLDACNQVTYILGPSTTRELVCYKGAWQNPTFPAEQRWGAGRYVFTKETILAAGRCSGVYASLDLFDERSGSGKLIALACDPLRSNRPTWVEYNPNNNTWSVVYLTNDTPSDAQTVQEPSAVVNSFEAQNATAGFGVASPYGMNFLFRSGFAYGNRPYIIRRNRSTGQFQGYDVPGNSVVQCMGGVYHPAFKAIMWLMRGATGDQVRIYSLFETAATPTNWNTTVIGSGGTYLAGTALGTVAAQRRSGSMIGRSATIVLGASATYDVYFWSATRGLVKGSLGIGSSGFTTQSWSIVNPRSSADPLMFSSTPSNTYTCLLGLDRGGDLSLQFGSFAENLPPFGFSASIQPDDYDGLMWFDPGFMVKNLGARHLWAGLNRGGYLWIANALKSSMQVEFSPNAQIRGDVILPNMAATNAFDWAATDDNKIGFCARNSANYLFFYLYDISTGGITLERQGLDFPNIGLLSSSPKMAFNPVLRAFEIVGQDNTRAGGQLLFFRRYLSGTWEAEQVGSGTTNLPSLGSQSCKSPCKPLVLDDGSFLVAGENGNNAVLILHKTASWSVAWKSSEGGFAAPVLAKTTGMTPRYFVFGGTAAGVRSAVGTSLLGSSAWDYLVNPFSSAVSVYTRVKAPEVFTDNDLVYVASPLAAETGTTDSQEFGVFQFSATGAIKGSAFAAKGRLTQNQSGVEEAGYTTHSWTFKGDLLYAATRPGRSQAHWTIRRSYNRWVCSGDSVVGSGRIVSLDNKQYRESFVSDTQTDGLFVTDSSFRSSSVLPLATREETELWGLKWGERTAGSLFSYGKFETTFTDDSTAPSGLLPRLGQRPWPRIIGSTQGILSGASIFGSGSGLRLIAPVGTSNYFGTSLPSNGIFRLKTLCTLTFYGTHRFRISDRDDKQYLIEGPLSFVLSEAKQHLVLDFATPDSLTLNAAGSPMSYWVFGDISKYRYPIFLGRNEDSEFILSDILGGKKLKHGHLEPREYGLTDYVTDGRDTEGKATHTRFTFDQITTGNYGSFKVKILGSNHGIQTLGMTDATQKQLVVRGPLAGGFTFLALATDIVRSAGPRIQPILTSLASGNIVILGQ